MKKFWWGIFFGALIGVLLLAPDSKVSYMVRDLFYQLQDTVVAVLDGVTDLTRGVADGVSEL
ncbi:MAG: hypothetical protein ACR2QH_04510 [Geminicoccaceae bacterium]|jgi:serine phosphatase RsbU (regulator of sigma subunit)